MKIKNYILLVLALFFSVGIRAQVTMHIDPNVLIDSLQGTSFPFDHGAISPMPTFHIPVYNQGNTTYIDSISFGYYISHGGQVNVYNAANSDSSGIEFHPSTVQIPAGGSALVGSVVFHFRDPQFVVGTSTVVIWPILYHNNPGIVDSSSVVLTVYEPTGIADDMMEDIKVYLFGSRLNIYSPENISGNIRIYDMSGRLLDAQRADQGTFISMDRFATGIYNIELTLNDGRRGVYKIFNGSRQ